MGIGNPGSFFNILICRLVDPEHYVVFYRVIEQYGFLGDQAHELPQGFQFDLLQINSINQDFTFIDIVESRDQVRKG